jgi:hypothetical protein
MAGPVGLGDWIAPGGTGAFVVPRLAAALASLSIVASAWFFGARVSRTHAIVAAFAAAIWFEFVAFAPHTLSEPLATAVILPAAVLLTRSSLSPRSLAFGGALLALAFVLRFQYAPAIAVLALGACWRRWRDLVPLTAGGVIAARDQRDRRSRARRGAFRLAGRERAAKSALRSRGWACRPRRPISPISGRCGRPRWC